MEPGRVFYSLSKCVSRPHLFFSRGKWSTFQGISHHLTVLCVRCASVICLGSAGIKVRLLTTKSAIRRPWPETPRTRKANAPTPIFVEALSICIFFFFFVDGLRNLWCLRAHPHEKGNPYDAGDGSPTEKVSRRAQEVARGACHARRQGSRRSHTKQSILKQSTTNKSKSKWIKWIPKKSKTDKQVKKRLRLLITLV